MRLTAKQDHFAQLVAKGESQYSAFCKAYPLQGRNSKRETLDSNASRLAADSKILARIKELREEALTHIKYDIEAHFKELEELRNIALKKDAEVMPKEVDLKTAGKMIELKGKVKGHYVEKQEIKQTNLEPTPEEREEMLKQVAEREGLTIDQLKKRDGLN